MKKEFFNLRAYSKNRRYIFVGSYLQITSLFNSIVRNNDIIYHFNDNSSIFIANREIEYIETMKDQEPNTVFGTIDIIFDLEKLEV